MPTCLSSVGLLVSLVAGPAEDEAKRWLRDWAVTGTPPAIEAEFVSTVTRSNLPDPVVTTGRWRAGFDPFYAYRLDYQDSSETPRRSSAENPALRDEKTMSWDSSLGEGRSLVRVRETLVPTGVISSVPPDGSGRIELPSGHCFYALDDRPLKSHLKLVRVTIRLLDPSGSRFAAFLSPGTGIVWAYVLDRSKDQPIEEVHVYVPKRAFLLPTKNKELGSSIELPEEFADKGAFAVRRILESSRIGRYSVPIRWAVDHAYVLPGDETVIALEKASIRIEEPKEGESLSLSWPPGARVYDPARGVAQWIGQNEEKLSGDVMSEATLDAILKQANITPRLATPAEKSLHLETNCAANASYLALALAGKPEALTGIVEALAVKGSGPETSLAAIHTLLEKRGVPCTPVKGQAEVLAMVRSGFALLHAATKSYGHAGGGRPVGHYMLVDDYDPITGTLRVLDPPVIPYRASIASVRKPWTGNALLLGDSIERLASRNRGLTVAGVGLFVCSVLCFVALALRSRRRTGVALSVLLLLVAGCTRHGRAPASSGVEVVGSSEHDFGEVRMPSKDVKHTFTLRNNMDRDLRIASVKKSCTCLSAAVRPEVIPAKGQAEVTVEIEGLVMAGTKTTLTMIEFDDPSVAAVSLTTKAFLVADYQVALAPLIWAVLPGTPEDTLLRRTFQVTEFLAKEPAADETTRVLSESPEARIEEVGPWKSRGWRSRGFVRETEISVAVRVPKHEASERKIVLKFDRVRGAIGGGSAAERSTTVTVLVRVL